jgi:hypothetical protein
MADIHPKLFATNKEIDKAKELIANGDILMVKAWEQIRKEAEETIISALPEGKLDDAGMRRTGVHRTAVLTPPLVMAWWLSGEEKYAKRAWEAFENLLTFEDWGVQTQPPYTDRHFLDTGVGAFVVALIYDGLYHYLNEEQKTKVMAAADKYVHIPAMAQYDGSARRTWQWNKAHHNWNGICNGGIIMSSLMFMKHDPERLSKLVAYAMADLPLYLKEFEPHGQSEEGLMYWHYGLMYTLPALDAVIRTLGTDFGYTNLPGLRKAGYFPLYLTGPVTSLSVGDDPVKTSRHNTFFWFSKHYNDPAMAKITYDLAIENGGSLKWFDMFYYDAELVAKGGTITPAPDHYVFGLELVTLRENWHDRNAIFAGIHGGANNANHGHLDAGTFDIQALGEVWAYGNLGRDDYTFPGYFSKTTLPGYKDEPHPQKEAGRWHFYRLRAEGKNCLVFNPTTRPDQEERAEAKFLHQHSSAHFATIALDLTSCYHRDVNFYVRSLSLDKKKKSVIISDFFDAKENALAWWSVHTKATIIIAPDGKTAYLRQNGKQVRVRLQTEGNYRFQILPATYLPGQDFPLTRNTENRGFRKLAVRFDDVKNMEIRVVFDNFITL